MIRPQQINCSFVPVNHSFLATQIQKKAALWNNTQKENQMRLFETEDMKWLSRHKKLGQLFKVSMAKKYFENVVVQYF